MIHDTVDVDKMQQFDSNPMNDQNVLLEMDEANFSSLREHNSKLLHTSIK